MVSNILIHIFAISRCHTTKDFSDYILIPRLCGGFLAVGDIFCLRFSELCHKQAPGFESSSNPASDTSIRGNYCRVWFPFSLLQGWQASIGSSENPALTNRRQQGNDNNEKLLTSMRPTGDMDGDRCQREVIEMFKTDFSNSDSLYSLEKKEAIKRGYNRMSGRKGGACTYLSGSE